MAKRRNPNRTMSLGAHLIELRNRLFWSALFIGAGTVGGWFLFDAVFAALQKPILTVAAETGHVATVNFGTVVGAFDTRIQVSVFIGLFLASPFWLFNLWAFINPGLKARERKYTFAFLGAAIPLFAAGAYLAWISMPYFIRSLLGFTPDGAANVINANEYMLFLIRVLTLFGASFVMPVALVMLNFAGVLRAKSILRGWRVAVFLIALITALATPSSDVISMILLAIPLIVLYFVAVFIATIRDRRQDRRRANAEAELDALLASDSGKESSS